MCTSIVSAIEQWRWTHANGLQNRQKRHLNMMLAGLPASALRSCAIVVVPLLLLLPLASQAVTRYGNQYCESKMALRNHNTLDTCSAIERDKETYYVTVGIDYGRSSYIISHARWAFLCVAIAMRHAVVVVCVSCAMG